MPTAIKRSTRRKPSLKGVSTELASLRARVEDLEDLRDLNAAIARNNGKRGVPWSQVKKDLGLG